MSVNIQKYGQGRDSGSNAGDKDSRGSPKPVGGINISRQGRGVSGRSEVSARTVYYVLDCSGSMSSGNKLPQAKKGILKSAYDAIEGRYTAGLIKFSDEASHLCSPQRDLSQFKLYLEEISAMSGTNILAALRIAGEKLLDMPGTRTIVIATDGQPSDPYPDPRGSTIREAKRLHEAGIDIIAIGTDDADLEFLQAISSKAEFAIKVDREDFSRAIAESAKKMLPELPSGHRLPERR